MPADVDGEISLVVAPAVRQAAQCRTQINSSMSHRHVISIKSSQVIFSDHIKQNALLFHVCYSIALDHLRSSLSMSVAPINLYSFYFIAEN